MSTNLDSVNSGNRLTCSFAPAYRSAIAFGFFFDFVLLFLLAAMVLNSGRSARYFMIAMMGHWLMTLVMLVRRPHSPTTVDLCFIRVGAIALMFVTLWMAPVVWSIIGASDLDGLQRLKMVFH